MESQKYMNEVMTFLKFNSLSLIVTWPSNIFAQGIIRIIQHKINVEYSIFLIPDSLLMIPINRKNHKKIKIHTFVFKG